MKNSSIPEWLSGNDDYIPQSDKDTFLDKSILSLLSILSKIKIYSGHRDKKFKVNAILKVLFTLILVILISLTRSFIFIVIANVYLLFLLSLMKGDEIIRILKICFVVSVFTMIVLLPAVYFGNYYSIFMITPKVFATVIAVNILSYSTPWNLITASLKTVFIPDLFIFVLDITIKYIFLLGEYSLNMLYALKLRSVGKNNKKYASLSGIAGTMFIKSTEMAAEMYSAMECRGFTGEYKAPRKIQFTIADLLYIVANVLMIIIFFYFKVV